ncbi:DDE transposase family protein [Moorena producens JHB]|uniref:DDE transposase family protein n=1 Tax=Moorena producens (strain JHB) TaxID=1454205 RepID=A0A1D9FXT2_MOOP1|nr:DDE transposase family protein [Moorena producens]AOY80177.1 DDE transposase family protein [Moorena producens JHB]
MKNGVLMQRGLGVSPKTALHQEADYILALKANQKLLYEEVKTWFYLAIESEFFGKDYSYNQEKESGHNRIDKREVWAVPVSSLPRVPNRVNASNLV